jgi:hypothetical protein
MEKQMNVDDLSSTALHARQNTRVTEIVGENILRNCMPTRAITIYPEIFAF